MSNHDIPLLTDIVADAEADDAENTKTQVIAAVPRPGPARVTDSTFSELAIFEPARAVRHEPASRQAAADALQRTPLAPDKDELVVQPSVAEPASSPDQALLLADIESVIAELQTTIAANTFELTDKLMRAAFSDIEARVFRHISTNLRQQLPELIDAVVREHLLERHKPSDEGE